MGQTNEKTRFFCSRQAK